MKPTTVLTWHDIEDERVRHQWARNCACEGPGDVVFVDPSYYEDSGTPTCGECGQDMQYDKTQVLT